MLINGYPFANFILMLLFFLIMWFDRKIMMKGGWFFYTNKVVASFSILGSFLLIKYEFYSWILMGVVLCYCAIAYIRVKKFY
jgi:hypothetical protein